MAQLFSDEDFPLPEVRALRRLGHDVLTAVEAGVANLGTPDDVILDIARAMEQAVVTFNWDDFVALHDRSETHAGIIVCQSDTSFVALAARIHAAIEPVPSLGGELIQVEAR